MKQMKMGFRWPPIVTTDIQFVACCLVVLSDFLYVVVKESIKEGDSLYSCYSGCACCDLTACYVSPI